MRRSRLPALSGSALVCALLSVSFVPASARPPRANVADPPRSAEFSVPAAVPAGFARSDTISFGYYQVIGENIYAVSGETWTWDHGASDPLEGWVSVDDTANPAWFRRISAASWGGHDNEVSAPILSGQGSAWLGRFEDAADSLCWDAGLGYGNLWCQRLTSPVLTYAGSGEVALQFSYFNDSESGFDYTRVLLLAAGDTLSLNAAGFTGRIGTPPSGPWAAFGRTITGEELGGPGERPFQVSFEFTSDVGWSDEDGYYMTTYGPFGADNVAVTGAVVEGDQLFAFETALDGWTASACPGVGSFFAVHPLGGYMIADPCQCRLAGNVAAMHDVSGHHPPGQNETLYSPIVDRTSLHAYNLIQTEWDQYVYFPQANGVLYRVGWRFYPYVCPQTGATGWGERMAPVWEYPGDQPLCEHDFESALDAGVPSDCDYVGFIYRVSCDGTGTTNVTPLVDNVRIRMTQVPVAPAIIFDFAAEFQDAFAADGSLDPSAPGNVDVAFNLRAPDPPNVRLGDSLVVNGPVVSSSTRWLARLWFRLPRTGPLQSHDADYNAWKTRVSDGLDIVGPAAQFAYGWMDSVEVTNGVYRNRFCSQFHEMDDDFVPGQEQGEANEILPDNVFVPGTKIQYFVTANYICTPETMFLLPDTAGGNFKELEILPGYRNVSGILKYPCLLYIDAYTHDPWRTIDHALNRVLGGAGPLDPIPDPSFWDRYDYLFASSCCHGPLARVPGATNGATLTQLLGYHTLLVNTGDLPTGTMAQADFQLFGDWLTTDQSGGNLGRQGFIGNGDDFGAIADYRDPGFLENYAGTRLICDAYNTAGCGPTPADTSYCVRIEDAPGALYPSDNTPSGGSDYDYDAFGNGCPAVFGFDVLGASGTGAGNRIYLDQDGMPPATTSYAQVANSVTSSGSGNYRTVIDGVSYGHLSLRDPVYECVPDPQHAVGAATQEIQAALNWIHDLSVPGLCVPYAAGDVPVWDGAGARVNALLRNEPNPFSPRTVIRFSLAEKGPAELTLYDVSGRRVRTLVSGVQEAGAHQVIWDGTDDAGRPAAKGVYWNQLRVGDYRSTRKMVLLE